MKEKEFSMQTAGKYLDFLFEKCTTVLSLPEIRDSDYEPLKREYNDFLDRIINSDQFNQSIKENIAQQRNKIKEIGNIESKKKILKDGFNIIGIIIMFLTAAFTGFGAAVSGKNASEARRSMIEEIRNNLSHTQFLFGRQTSEL